MNHIIKVIFLWTLLLSPVVYGFSPFMDSEDNNNLYISKDQKRAHIDGIITDNFSEIIKALPKSIEVLKIDSVGGSVPGANKAAEEIYKRKITTFVSTRCYSACTLIFQAGHKRQASKKALFMYHTPRKRVEGYKKEIDTFYALYEKYGLSSSFIEKIKNSTEDLYLSGFDEVPLFSLYPTENRESLFSSAIEKTSSHETYVMKYDNTLKDADILHEFYPLFNDITEEMVEDMRKKEPEITRGKSDKRVKETFIYPHRVSEINKEEWNTLEDFHHCDISFFSTAQEAQKAIKECLQ